MIFDNKLCFTLQSDDTVWQNIGTDSDLTSALDSTNALDLVAGKDYLWTSTVKYGDPLAGGKMRLIVYSDETGITAASSETLTVSLYLHSAASSFGSGTLVASGTKAIGTTAAKGLIADIGLPNGLPSNTLRYLGVTFSTATDVNATGNIFVALVDHTENATTTISGDDPTA